jgi:hypothetical protein
MTGPSAGDLAIGAAGAVLAALVDVFVTVFNYDGFSFLANRLHGVLWKGMRALTRGLPERARHTALSLGSASMLPATYILWLGLEICGFAMMYDAGLSGHAFSSRAGHGVGTAFYLSAGDITSLTFGDVTARSGLMRALVDLETIVGLTTFTLALGYVVTTFDVLKTLDGLHATVRRHAGDPGKPSSILARHFRGGQPSELPALLEKLTDKLEDYDRGLRRYPVVYYFHTRRLARSIPRIFSNLGRLVALLRWGLPADEPMSQDPLLVALIAEYGTTLDRLQRSFVGPPELELPDPLPHDEFVHAYAAALEGDGTRDGRVAALEGDVTREGHAAALEGDGTREGHDAPLEGRGIGDRHSAAVEGNGTRDAQVTAFKALQDAARSSAGISADRDPAARDTYEQYREWLPFEYRNRVLLRRVADALGYELV